MATERFPPRPHEGHTYEGDTARLPSPQLCGTRCPHNQAGDLQVGAEHITSKTKKEKGNCAPEPQGAWPRDGRGGEQQSWGQAVADPE